MTFGWLRERFVTESECIHECRRCGEVVDAGCTTCPTCDHGGIATYEIE